MYLSILSFLIAFPAHSIPLRYDFAEKTSLSADEVNKLSSNKISFKDRLSTYERCCPDEGEDCTDDVTIDCHATEMFLRKSHVSCCEEDGEDCPGDHVSSCEHVEHVLSRVFLDPKRVNSFEKCCPDEGEDCPDEDVDCHESAKFLHKGHEQCCEAEGEDCPPGVEDTCHRISKLFFANRLHSFEKCCPDEGEDCSDDSINCHATEMFLRKSHASCCEEDGEDCPSDHVSSCEHVEHVLSRVFLDPKRVNSFEKCCPDEGEDCPDDDYDCHESAKFLHKGHEQCCEKEGEDCPPGVEDTCHRISKLFFANRLHSFEKCCPDEGEDCSDDSISCHATEMFLRKSYVSCCEEDGEDCPDNSVSSCEHVEHVLSRVFLDPKRVNSFEKCCPDEGEDCPDADYDCHESAKFLHKGHEQCCEEEGEDCPPGVEDTCQRVSFLLRNT